MELATILPYLLALVPILAHRLGFNVPGLPAPTPSLPPAKPEADKPLVDCLNWLLDVKTGKIRLDERDVETLKMLKPLVDAVSEGKR